MTCQRASRAGIGAVCLLVAGCAIPHAGQKPGIAAGPRADGFYRYTVHVEGTGPFGGSTSGYLAAQPAGDGFRANSRPGFLGEVLGGFRGGWVNTLGFGRLPAGCFMAWEAAPAQADHVGGTLHIPGYRLQTTHRTIAESIMLRGRSQGPVFGVMTIVPGSPPSRAEHDYATLAAEIEQTLRSELFDPALVDGPQVQAYLAALRRNAAIVRDDAEFALGAMLAAGELPFSHMRLSRALSPEGASLIAEAKKAGVAEGPAPTAPAEPIVALETADGIAVLRVRSFATSTVADEIDAAFVRIVAEKPAGLVIDLRGNTGGTFASSRVAAHLVREPMPGGAIFKAARRGDVLAGRAAALPVRPAEMTLAEFYAALDATGGFRWEVAPREPVFAGTVALVVDGAVASASEPLVAGLQESKRAVVIGQPTAGAMLSTQQFPLKNGWILTVPTADYLTPAGIRLEGRGVTPDLVAAPDSAIETARAWIREQLSAANR